MSYIHRPSHIFIASDGGAVKELIPEQSIDSPIGVRLSQMTFVNSFGSFPEGENVISFEIRWLTGAQGNVSYVTRNVTLTLETDVRYTSGSIVSTLGSLLAKDDVANGYTDKTSDHLVFKYHTDENILLWECLGVVNVKVTRGNKRLGYSDRAMGGVPYPSSDHMKNFSKFHMGTELQRSEHYPAGGARCFRKPCGHLLHTLPDVSGTHKPAVCCLFTVE